MSSPDETIAIEPAFSKKELEKAQAADVESSAQPVDNPFVNPAHVEKAARDKINNQAELYRSLVRALKRRLGFGILFLQCTPAKGKEIFSQLQTDLPQKRIGRLTLTKPIENLKALVEGREDLDELNVLFVEGIEHSLSPYIKSEIGRNDYYKLEVLPPILDHLNLHRENFRNQFRHLCLVFVVPPFALKYFMYRAVDFFSWHSGVWTFSPPEEELAKETASALDVKYDQYLKLSNQERGEKILELRDLIDVENQSDEQRSRLLIELNWVLSAEQNYKSALDCCKAAADLQPSSYQAWYARGHALSALGRKEEAIAAYDIALTIKPNGRRALSNKGNDLAALGRAEEAMLALNAAVEPAETDSDFEAIRDRPQLQALIAQYEQKQHSEARSLEP